MRPAEKGMLMLTCALGQAVTPLTPTEFQYLSKLVQDYKPCLCADDLTERFFRCLGLPQQQAERIMHLISREEVLNHYVAQPDLSVVTRISEEFPDRLRRLGAHCPTALFCKGDVSLLKTRCISLVGARVLPERNIAFAELIGTLAAKEGYTLVSGGAVGADTAAQNACLAAAGRVICFVPDALKRYCVQKNVLFCSDEGWEFAFSSARALRRNHFIHALGEKTFVARCTHTRGGTWSGTSYNLQHGLSEVYILDDNVEGAKVLCSMGAISVDENIDSLADLMPTQLSIFD